MMPAARKGSENTLVLPCLKTIITMSTLTHFDAQGQAHMVDVAAKSATHRIGIAGGRIEMQPATLAIIESGSAKKGDVLGIARVAGQRTTNFTMKCRQLAPKFQPSNPSGQPESRVNSVIAGRKAPW